MGVAFLFTQQRVAHLTLDHRPSRERPSVPKSLSVQDSHGVRAALSPWPLPFWFLARSSALGCVSGPWESSAGSPCMVQTCLWVWAAQEPTALMPLLLHSHWLGHTVPGKQEHGDTGAA